MSSFDSDYCTCELLEVDDAGQMHYLIDDNCPVHKDWGKWPEDET